MVNTTIDLTVVYSNQNILTSDTIINETLQYSIPLIIALPSAAVIDFYHESNSFFVTNDIPNTIYFEAFISS